MYNKKQDKTQTKNMKRFFKISLCFLIVCIGINFFACTNANKKDEENLQNQRQNTNQSTIDSATLSKINMYKPYFGCNFEPYEQNPVFTKVTVRNISPFRFEDLFLKVLFLNKDGETVRTETMGVYSSVFSGDEMSIYLLNFETQIETAYIIDAIDDYFV